MNLPLMSPLIEYGIQNEQSDIRAHVAPLAKRVLVYQTKKMLELLVKKHYPIGRATQPGMNGQITGEGYKVPVGDVPGLRVIPCESVNWSLFPDRSASTSEKGKAAVELVCRLLSYGRFPLWIRTSEEDSTAIQISGTDIVVTSNQRIQVKCDWTAGLREWHEECSGNVFVQTAETNPFKRI